MSKVALTDEDVQRFKGVAIPAVPDGFRKTVADKVVQIEAMPNGMMALTNLGRMFFRELDSRNFDGRNPVKYVWREVEGPSL